MQQNTNPSATPFRALLRAGGISLALALAAGACASDATDPVATNTVPEVVEETAETQPEAPAEEPTTAPEPEEEEATAQPAPTEEPIEEATSGEVAVSGDLVAMFMDGALAEDIATVDCTLSDGTQTSCYQITVAGIPADEEVGPFCPTTIEATADEVGIWLDGENIYDIDGQFILDLPEIYNDDNWLLHDEDGHVHVTDTQEAFEAAARPDVAEEYQNHCVEGQIAWLDNGEPITSTVQIPVTPVPSTSGSQAGGNLGVTLNGVIIAAQAPVDAILGAYTIAAFDDCGGHINPADGYHLHGATGCSEVGDAGIGETPMFAIALDGYAIHSPLDEADVASANLDQCNGHTTEDLGYHYHANNPEDNAVLSCFTGQTTASEDAGAGPGRRPEG